MWEKTQVILKRLWKKMRWFDWLIIAIGIDAFITNVVKSNMGVLSALLNSLALLAIGACIALVVTNGYIEELLKDGADGPESSN